MVIFDSSFMLLLLDSQMPPPTDPLTGMKVDHAARRINHLMSELHKAHRKVLIPTPVLSEILVRADKARSEYIAKIQKSSAFNVEPFCGMAAIELALMTASAISKGDKRNGSKEIWSKIKFDRQIIAIGKVHRVKDIYCGDNGLIKSAKDNDMNPITIGQINLPPQDAQSDMFKLEEECGD